MTDEVAQSTRALTLSRAIYEAFRNYLITMAVLAVAFVIGRAVADWMNL